MCEGRCAKVARVFTGLLMNTSMLNNAVKGKQKKPVCGLVLCEWKMSKM
jgi:hypothetical protein